jgi:hypothetical protein
MKRLVVVLAAAALFLGLAGRSGPGQGSRERRRREQATERSDDPTNRERLTKWAQRVEAS